MQTGFSDPAAGFVSASQVARVETEAWAEANMYCPNCGNSQLSRYNANRPVADFFCSQCGDQYELKSKNRSFGRKIANGAYSTKMERLASDTSPNLILLHYDRKSRLVENLRVVPKFFFTGNVVEKRKPLAKTARRAGWVGSNILLDRIPEAGKITVVNCGIIRDRDEVLRDWNALRFVEKRLGDARGWLTEVMHCIERIGQDNFMLSDIYDFENDLASIFPSNNNIRPKIRQQLQVLRDAGYIYFLGGGRYRLVDPQEIASSHQTGRK